MKAVFDLVGQKTRVDHGLCRTGLTTPVLTCSLPSGWRKTYTVVLQNMVDQNCVLVTTYSSNCGEWNSDVVELSWFQVACSPGNVGRKCGKMLTVVCLHPQWECEDSRCPPTVAISAFSRFSLCWSLPNPSPEWQTHSGPLYIRSKLLLQKT